MTAEEFNIITIIIAIIGAITGAVSLAITIYKARQDRPKLSFTVEEVSYDVSSPEESADTAFYIRVRIDNKGERSTAIYNATLSFEYNEQKHKIERAYPTDKITTVMPHDSTRENFKFVLSGVRVQDEVKESVLEIGHTHGQTRITIPTIK